MGSARIVHGGKILDATANVIDAGLQDGIVVFAIVSGTVGDQRPPAPQPIPAAAAAAAVVDDDGARIQAEGEQEANDENVCRFCMGGPSDELGVLFSPCHCSGSMRFVHVECLNRWRRVRRTLIGSVVPFSVVCTGLRTH